MERADTYQAPETLPGLRQFGMILVALGLVLTGIGFLMSGLDRFFQAYLVAYTFWMGIVLGSLALLMTQHLTGGAWGVVLRRPLEAAVKTLPIMAALFLPIALGMQSIYEWARPEALNDPIIQEKAALPQHAVLPGPAGLLLRGVDRDGTAAHEVVERARPHG